MVRNGILDEIVSDNGFQFSLQEFKKFKDLYEFDYVISFFIYSQLSGKVENLVKIAQRIMFKVLEVGSDFYLGFFDFCNIFIEGLGIFLVQCFFG